MTDRAPTRLEAEGYARIRHVTIPAAQAILAIEPEALAEAIRFAERGVKAVEANPAIKAADAERSRNELETIRLVQRFRQDLKKLAEGQAARDRLLET